MSMNVSTTTAAYANYQNNYKTGTANKKKETAQTTENTKLKNDYGNFSLRFKPVDINFTKPNWDTIMTKRDKPAMSEEEFTKQ